MKRFYSDSPDRDFDCWDAYMHEQECQLPVCADCGEAVQEHYYLINDEVICPDCMESNYRKDVDWL